MRSHSCRRFALCLLPFLAFAGCASSPLPPVEEVKSIRLTVSRLPNEVMHQIRTVDVAAPADIEEIMHWLSTIDWSQGGTDLKVVGMPAADGGITIFTTAGQTQDYSFYWDGKFVNTRANLLIRGGDVGKLQQIVERLIRK